MKLISALRQKYLFIEAVNVHPFIVIAEVVIGNPLSVKRKIGFPPARE
jgi:hypothetical protein